MKGADYVNESSKVTSTPDCEAQSRPVTMLKRIGSTTYEVSVHFSQTSKETVNDKITRLIKNEAADRKAAGQ
jgi:hypothetical protein